MFLGAQTGKMTHHYSRAQSMVSSLEIVVFSKVETCRASQTISGFLGFSPLYALLGVTPTPGWLGQER